MFKIFSRLFGGGSRALRAAPVPPPRTAAAAPASAKKAAAPAPEKAGAAGVGTPPPPTALDRSSPPEQLCGLTPGMSQEEIRDHLAMLYRRHNRAASSLEAGLREEAEIMLDAVVRCRETFLGMPAASPADPKGS